MLTVISYLCGIVLVVILLREWFFQRYVNCDNHIPSEDSLVHNEIEYLDKL